MSAIDKLAQKTELINLKSEEKARLATAQSEEDKIFIKAITRKDALSYVRQIQAVNEKIALLSTKDKRF